MAGMVVVVSIPHQNRRRGTTHDRKRQPWSSLHFGVQTSNDEPVPKYWNGTALREGIGCGSRSRHPKNRARGDRGCVVEPWLTSDSDRYE